MFCALASVSVAFFELGWLSSLSVPIIYLCPRRAEVIGKLASLFMESSIYGLQSITAKVLQLGEIARLRLLEFELHCPLSWMMNESAGCEPVA